ncbi:MAG: hypothetical protein Q8M07_01095 [Prosthecobacter sp.]|nr:hypothetical protein [Prosthecobacter sp.]
MTRWGDEEDEALQYLPHRAQVLYLRGLRRWMDYETGIVGRGREVSMQMFVELLEVGSKFTSNNKTGSVTAREVRTSLYQLERVGLIERIEGRRISALVHTLVFRLPLAAVDNSVKNSQVTVRSQSGHTSGGTASASSGAACAVSQGTVMAQSGHTSQGTPPVSGIRTTLSPVVVDVESIGADPGERPESAAEWFAFFSSRCGVRFEHRKIHTAKNGQLFAAWVGRGVCVGDVLEAMAMAHGALGGSFPDGPSYYGWALDAVMQARAEGVNGSGRQVGKRVSGADILAAGCADAFR